MSISKREAAIISAFTGIMLGRFDDMHEYVEEILKRPVFTHEMGFDHIATEIKDAAREDFIALKVGEE